MQTKRTDALRSCGSSHTNSVGGGGCQLGGKLSTAGWKLIMICTETRLKPIKPILFYQRVCGDISHLFDTPFICFHPLFQHKIFQNTVSVCHESDWNMIMNGMQRNLWYTTLGVLYHITIYLIGDNLMYLFPLSKIPSCSMRFLDVFSVGKW